MSLSLTPSLLTPEAEGPRPLLMVGPSLGTSVTALWGPALPFLADRFTVVGWDLPGHGSSAAHPGPFSLSDLASAVVRAADHAAAEHGAVDAALPRFHAGVSIAGAVSLTLAVDHPGTFRSLAVLCSAAKLGTPEGWRERADLVAQAGTPTMVEGSAKRWFAPGFLEKHPERVTPLLHALQQTDRHSYAAACRALADYDLTERLGEASDPLLALAGEEDTVCPPADADTIAKGVPEGRAVTLRGVAHQAPTEDPENTAEMLKDFFS
ncbi:alpha/beta fold hydrolase [Nesterenkonia sp. NBAIMH1]|uniref:alpha/beta fold hydrolase n=1 Tax=Nesterenkonia sp. NBAIMH1 TaxID=2600320 RepID=UPI0011B716EA|nr:alpha/beta hydrolase [Nesterenkonia sp. NBAIMH1]